MGWPEATIFIIALALCAMHFKVFDYFHISKGSISFSRMDNDIEFLRTIDAAVDEIDNNCRLLCWHFIVDHLPSVPQNEAVYQLLETVSFNHILRAAQAMGYANYVKSKQAVISYAVTVPAEKKRLNSQIASILAKLTAYSKDAAAKKIELYTAHVDQKDLSPICKEVLKQKMEKNKGYLAVSVTV